jgi:hypothetical protein
MIWNAKASIGQMTTRNAMASYQNSPVDSGKSGLLSRSVQNFIDKQ